METVTDFIFLGSKVTTDGDCSHEIKRRLLLGRKAMINVDSMLKNRDITLLTKVHTVKLWFFMYGWELDHKEGWVPFELWCWRRLLKSPLNSKEIEPVHPDGNQPWILIARTEAETTLLWPPDGKSWLIGKDPGAGKDCEQEERKAAEYEMVRQHHQLNGYEFEQILGDSEGQRRLACCSLWGHKRQTWLSD